MGILFATDEWATALLAAINASDGYRNASQKWEGDFYFHITAGGGMAEDTYLYLDLWHGECRSAFSTTDEAAKSPAFVLSGPIDVWRQVLEGKIDPIRALAGRKLKLKGNMMKIMKVPKSATELVGAAGTIDTDWP